MIPDQREFSILSTRRACTYCVILRGCKYLFEAREEMTTLPDRASPHEIVAIKYDKSYVKQVRRLHNLGSLAVAFWFVM